MRGRHRATQRSYFSGVGHGFIVCVIGIITYQNIGGIIDVIKSAM